MTVRDRNAHIDFLRGIAVLLVLLLHFALAYGIKNAPFRDLIGQENLERVFLNGNYGVTMFFVISGYLITSMSLARWGDANRISIRQFYTYRFARIMPSIMLVLLIVVSLGLLHVPYFDNRSHGQPMPDSFFVLTALSVLTFWHNVLMQSAGWFNYCLNIYWSLSVEEVFYLAFPLVFVALRRKSLIAMCCAVLIVLGPIYRGMHSDDELFFECGYLANFDAISMGCLCAFLVAKYKVHGNVAKILRTLAAVGLVIFYLRGIAEHEVSGFSLIAFFTAVYLTGSVSDLDGSFASARATAFMRWLGRHSYELYLFHIVVLAVLRNIWDKKTLPAVAWLPWLLLFISVSVLAAALVARFISEPANRAIRKRFGLAVSLPSSDLQAIKDDREIVPSETASAYSRRTS